MPTRETISGDAVLVELGDDDAVGLCPGDVVVVPNGTGLAPLLVARVRLGVAYDNSNPPRPYEVPVVEGWVGGLEIEGESPAVFAVPDCMLPFTETEAVAHDAARQSAAA